MILAHNGGPGALPYAPARRVSFSELLGASVSRKRAERFHLIGI